MESYVFQSLSELKKSHPGGTIIYTEYWAIGIRRVWIKVGENYFCEFTTDKVTQQLRIKDTL